ncbi:hypothetical protein FGO68_gene13036 [Halteria grandinella]|uniref:Uncharacterized protein n=1 Tax=Halteria grandinella TaxID=5974 RepID=A0A8J8T9D9_HALGN|nr:hypothetical protein FGO68_gene13036 [Halteria grandinella]
MSPQRFNRPPQLGIVFPKWQHEELQGQAHTKPLFIQMPLFAEKFQRFEEQRQQENDNPVKVPLKRQYIKRKPMRLIIQKRVINESEQISIPKIELQPYEEDIRFRECNFPKVYSASQMINHEQLGITFIKISMTEDQGVIQYAVDVEVKQRNQNFGPLQLSQFDIKQCFQDIIIMNQQQRENIRVSQKDHLMIDKIGRLLVSKIETVHKHMTRDILLKIAKVMLSHNIIIKRRITGKKFCLILANESLRKSFLPKVKNEKGNNNYYEQLIDLKLLSVQSITQNSLRKTKICPDSMHLLINKTVRISGLFVVTSIAYHRLINKWVLTIYISATQKTFKSYFSFKQLKKIHSLLSKQKEDISKLGMSGIEYLDQTVFNNSSLKKKHNDGRYATKQPLKVTEKSLKLFNQKTASFQDKDITEEFSINKTLQFLQNNGNFLDKNNQSQTNLNNNLRYIDRDRKMSDFQYTESVASEQVESQRAADFNTPAKQNIKIRLGKSSTKHKKQLLRKTQSKQRKELMFNNDYLNCYFKLHEDTQKRLEQTQLDWVESVKSKDENDEVIGIDEDNLAFNRQQMLPFWKRLLSSLSFSDSFGGDEEDGEKTFKFMLRITKEGKCYNKKLHFMLFEDEIEQVTQSEDKSHNFNLLWKCVSLDPLSEAFENPYGGGASCLSMIKQKLSIVDPSEYMLNLKVFNIQTGKMTKSKITIQSLMKDNLLNYRNKISIDDLRQLIRNTFYDIEFQKQQTLLQNFTGKENFEYQPSENKLVSDIIFKVHEQAITKNKRVDAKEVLKARDEFIKYRRLQKNDFTPQFTKIHSILLHENNSQRIISIQAQFQLNAKSVAVRIYNPELFFKHDYTIYFQEIIDKHQLSKGILIKASTSHDRKYLVSLLARLSEMVLPEILQDYKQRYFQSNVEGSKSESKVKQIFKNDMEPRQLKLIQQTSEFSNQKISQSATKHQIFGQLKVSTSNVFQKIKQSKLENLKSIEVSTLTAGAIANNISGIGNVNPLLNQSRDNSMLSNTMLSKNLSRMFAQNQTKSQPHLLPQSTGKFGLNNAIGTSAQQTPQVQWSSPNLQNHGGINIPHLQKQAQLNSQPAIQVRQAGLTPDQSRVESVVTLGGFKFMGKKKKKKKKKRQILRKDNIDFRQQDDSEEREEEEQ